MAGERGITHDDLTGPTEFGWDQFFEIMAAILNMPGTWQDKAVRVKDEASQRDQGGTLMEFSGWFAEETGVIIPDDEEDV
jgi:hypothetical protein